MERDVKKKKSVRKIIFYIFGAMMIGVYIGMAYLIVFSSLFEKWFPDTVRYIVGVLLFIYGIFRGYRLVRDSENLPQ